MSDVMVRTLGEADRAVWRPLWQGYQDFYRAQVPEAATDLAWRRFADPAEPMAAFGAFVDGALVGIVHLILHRSTWTEGDYCYLQDLFTAPDQRGRGVGRALITHAYEWGRSQGASRVYWLTHETNAQAMILYDAVAERTGFVQYRKLL